MFPVLGMIQTGQSSVQCRAQSGPGWYSDSFPPDGLDIIKLQLQLQQLSSYVVHQELEQVPSRDV